MKFSSTYIIYINLIKKMSCNLKSQVYLKKNWLKFNFKFLRIFKVYNVLVTYQIHFFAYIFFYFISIKMSYHWCCNFPNHN